MFSVTSRESFTGLDEIRENILRVKTDESTPLILVGNKCDLQDNREVSETEAEGVANSWGVPYVETSAKTKLNVDKIYYDLLTAIQQCKESANVRSQQGQPKKKKCKRKCTLL